MDYLKIITELGFPIAAAIASGSFVFLTLKFILAGVTSGIKGINETILALNSRVDTMVNDVQRVDIRISQILGVDPDYNRIARATKEDQRKD